MPGSTAESAGLCRVPQSCTRPEPSRGGDVPCDVPFVLRMAHHRSPKSQLLPGSSRIRRLTPRTPRSAQLNSVPTVSLPRFLVSRSPLLPGSSYTARASKSLFSSPPPPPSVGECAPPAFANSRPGQHRRERRDDRSDKRRADRARRRDYDEAALPESGVDVPARRKRCSARGARREERETSERARTFDR